MIFVITGERIGVHLPYTKTQAHEAIDIDFVRSHVRCGIRTPRLRAIR